MGVERVSDSGCKTQEKIRAVKHWLTQAERHYGVNSPTRGQMELLIAEAELRSTRNAIESHDKWRLHVVAQGVAIVIAMAGIGGFWWWNESAKIDTPIPVGGVSTVIMSSTPVSIPTTGDKILARPATDKETTVAAGADAKNSVQEVKSTEPVTHVTAPQTALSPEEMNRLVQAAGQSLRGRTKP